MSALRAIDALIVAARNADVLDIAVRCGAVLRLVGHEHIGPCPRCGGNDRYSINTRKQVFRCRSCKPGGVTGDEAGNKGAIDLVMHARGCSFNEAVEFITGQRVRSEPPTAEERQRRERRAAEAAREAQRRDAEAARDAERARAIAARIVAGLTPLRGTPGEQYLSQTRCIDTSQLGQVLDEPYAIGWHSAVFFNEPGHPLHGQRLGCIVGIMTDAITAMSTGAISRTYIGGNLRKVGKAKTLGMPAGIVRLSRDEDVHHGLHLAEGIETSLAAISLGFPPIWSTGSTGRMHAFPVLDGIGALTIFADHDPSGAGEVAARECEARWLAAGREVRVLRLKKFGDLNDALIAKAI